MEEILEWEAYRGLLRYEPKHENGVGRYHKTPGSGDDEKGFFTFIRAVYDKRFYQEEVDHINDDHSISMRCDSGAPKKMPMPTSLHETDDDTGLCTFCGSGESVYGTTNSHNCSLTNSIILRMPIHGYKGFIGYLELRDQEAEDKEVYENTNMARTLQELFKILLEWEWVYLNLDQNDVCAELAYNILEEQQLPENLRQWLWDEMPDMHVAKFFKGDIDARQRPNVNTIPEMTEDFEHWCWFKIARTPAIWTYGVR
jgi:hypothetical protein